MCGRAYHPHWKKHHARKWFKQRFSEAYSRWQAPVNVVEFDNRYELQLFAAGYSKTDFKVSLSGNTLVITVEKGTTATGEGGKWKRQEFHAQGFDRHFELNETIDKEAITAKYENGILHLSLPKLEGFETIHQDIDIA